MLIFELKKLNDALITSVTQLKVNFSLPVRIHCFVIYLTDLCSTTVEWLFIDICTFIENIYESCYY